MSVWEKPLHEQLAELEAHAAHLAAQHVCSTCRDSHVMPVLAPNDTIATVNCLFCPHPCDRCWDDDHNYCRKTPCSCKCHEVKPNSKELRRQGLWSVMTYGFAYQRVPAQDLPVIKRWVRLRRLRVTRTAEKRLKRKELAKKFRNYIDRYVGLGSRESANRWAWDLAGIVLGEEP